MSSTSIPASGSSPVAPSAQYSPKAIKIPFTRRIPSTEVLSINVADIKFDLSAGPDHPYEDPQFITSPTSQTGKAILYAAEKLRTSDIPVAFPTETVYGLGAAATRDEPVKNIFAVKDRFTDNPLIVHVASLKQARQLLLPANAAPGTPAPEIPSIYQPLIDKYWPGPLTVLLPLPNPTKLSPYVYSTQTTVGVRIPDHPVALALSLTSQLPIAAPSANKSGLPSPTTAKHVAEDLYRRVELILDGGACNVGLESTVVDGLSDPPAILRPGGISLEQIRACPGWENIIVHKESSTDGLEDSSSTSSTNGSPDGKKTSPGPRAPGMKYKHYSPACGVILYLPGAKEPGPSELLQSAYGRKAKLGVLRTRTWQEGAFSNIPELDARGVEVYEDSLGSSGEEISRNLFGALRRMDDLEVSVVHIEGIGDDDEGLAVMNRLRKAASVVVRLKNRY